MKPVDSKILTINGGSSSIKFALYATVKPLKRVLHGTVDRIGLSGTNLTFHDADGKPSASRKLAVTDHKSAVNSLMDWLEKLIDFSSVKAVGHRVVHGMKHTEPELVTKKLLDELYRISPNDPDHLPREIELIETFRQLESGLLGVSETSSDMRDLLKHEKKDVRAAEAVALFDYQAKNGLAPMPLRSVDWTRSSSQAASAKMRQSSVPAFAMGWIFSASNWTSHATGRLRR
jgi:acetate kinase